MLKTIIRFGIVGVINSIIDYCIFEILVAVLHVHSSSGLFICTLISGGLAVINSYFWNKRWTFKDKNKDYVQQFIRFALLNAVSLTINATAVIILNGIFPANFMIHGHAVKSLYLTKALAILITMVFNFITYRAFVFKQKDGTDGAEEYVYVVD